MPNRKDFARRRLGGLRSVTAVNTDPPHLIAGTPLVDVVLPCLDEAAALPGVLAGLPPGWRAIVVDNGSVDGSAELARRLGALVVGEPRRGYGSAVHAGLMAATAELVATCDADGSLDLADLPVLAAPVLAGSADLALGRRIPRPARAWPVHARLANAVLARIVQGRTGLRLHDLGPIRVARRSELLALAVQDRRSGYPLELVLRAAAAGWRVTERAVDYRPRVGRSKVTGTLHGTVQAVQDMRRLLVDPPTRLESEQ